MQGVFLFIRCPKLNTMSMGLRGPKPKRKEIIWSGEFAYSIGLMASDGCLSSDGRHLTFVSKDKEQVQNVKKCFDVTASIYTYSSGGKGNTNRYYRVQWGDITLYNFFIQQIGLTPRKSLTLGKLGIPDMYYFDFLRGSFDGDGCFYSYFDPRWKNSYMFYFTIVSASQVHVEWLQQTNMRLLGVRGHITSQKSEGQPNTMYQIRYAKRETLVLLKSLYPSPNTLCLSRKRLKIEKALGIVGESLP